MCLFDILVTALIPAALVNSCSCPCFSMPFLWLWLLNVPMDNKLAKPSDDFLDWILVHPAERVSNAIPSEQGVSYHRQENALEELRLQQVAEPTPCRFIKKAWPCAQACNVFRNIVRCLLLGRRSVYRQLVEDYSLWLRSSSESRKTRTLKRYDPTLEVKDTDTRGTFCEAVRCAVVAVVVQP